MARRQCDRIKGYRPLFLIWLAFVLPALAQPVLRHVPPRQVRAGSALTLDCTLKTGPDLRVQKANIFYRAGSDTTYRSVTLQSIGENWQGVVPARHVRGTKIAYFIVFLFNNQSLKTFPERNPYHSPHELEIMPPTATATLVPPAPGLPQTSAPPATTPVPIPSAAADAGDVAATDSLLLLTPDQDATYEANEVLLAVSYNGPGDLDPLLVRISMDGADVTRQAEISSALITYSPTNLSPGRHIIEIQAVDSRQTRIPPLSVRFFVTGADKPQEQSREKMYAHAYSDLAYEEYGNAGKGIAMAGAEVSGRWKSLSYRGHLFVTSLEDRHFQPRNRFGFSLENPWIGVSGGDVYPRYNELILAGKRVRGVSGYLHLGLVNMDVVYGHTQRAVKTTWKMATGGTGTDSLAVNRPGTFSQSLIGIRPSLGDGRHFQLGLTLLKIKDDTSSIAAGVMPKDNLVIGPDVKLSMIGGRVLFTAQAAVSAITHDIYPGAVTTDDVKRAFGSDFELPIDPQSLDDLLIINDSTIPLNPLQGGSLAYTVNLRLNLLNQYLNMGYRSIGSEYISLANPWLRKDLRGFFINDRLRLFSNRAYITLGYEQYADNFSEENSNPAIDLRTLNYAVTLLPGGNYPQFNISLRDQLRDNHVDTISVHSYQISSLLDSTTVLRDEREKIWFRDLALQASQNFRLFDLSHQISLGYISSRNIDDHRGARSSGYISPELTNRIVLLSLTTRFLTPLTTTLSYSNNVMNGAGIPDLDYNTLGFSSEYRLLQNRLSTFADWQYSAIEQKQPQGDLSQNRMQLRLGARWQVSPGQIVMLEGQLWRYRMELDDAADQSDTDTILRLRFDRYF